MDSFLNICRTKLRNVLRVFLDASIVLVVYNNRAHCHYNLEQQFYPAAYVERSTLKFSMNFSTTIFIIITIIIITQVKILVTKFLL